MQACNVIKIRDAKLYEVFKITYFAEHQRMTSELWVCMGSSGNEKLNFMKVFYSSTFTANFHSPMSNKQFNINY